MSHRHAFIDTNILVYVHDSDSANKHLAAQELVRSLWDCPYPPAISTQVLQELYISLAKKGASESNCKKIVGVYYAWEVIGHDVGLIETGISFKDRYKLSLWDGLIVAAAIKAKAELLYTEDLQNGQKFDQILIVNPFR